MTDATIPDLGVSFPPSVFEAPVLRGLDARARREIEAAGRVLVLGAGARVFRAGEQGEAFFVVADGEVGLEALKRGDAIPTPLRNARAGESFGEECVVGLARRADAVVQRTATIAEIPVHVFRRAAGRSGAGEGKLERVLRRAATKDLFATIAFTRSLPERDLDVLLDAAAHLTVARGQPVYLEGEPARELYFVIDGLVQLQHDDGERLHVRGYVGRGDFFGDAEIVSASARRASAIASGKSALVAVPAKVAERLFREHPQLLPAMRRVAEAQEDAQRAVVGKAAMNATGHIFKDLYRMQVARSLLVIDLETCVRCGHCAWACADVHGESRLVRRGDKAIAKVDGRGQDGAPSSLLLPNSCQHCESPACMVDCPTGAIAKDAGGEVFVRAELCTGCGACAKACPWENIQMSARPETAPKPQGAADDFELLAVKCDLCRGYEAPACVQACPTESVFRLNPAEEIGDVRELLRGGPSAGRARSSTPSAAPLIVGATLAAVAFAGVGWVMRAREAWSAGGGVALLAGIGGGLGMVGLLAYALPKRGVRLWMKKRAAAEPRQAHVPSRVKKHLGVHIALGLVTAGLALAHAPFPFRGASPSGVVLSALLLASTALGIFTAIAYALVPRRLTALERRSALPEDFAGARRGLVDRLYREASGKSELVKKLIETSLVPYANFPLGFALLLASGRSLRDEERRVRLRIDEKLQGRGKEKLAGLEGLVKIVVELRALSAQRLLLRALRFGLPLHIVTFALATAALAIHVAIAVLRGR